MRDIGPIQVGGADIGAIKSPTAADVTATSAITLPSITSASAGETFSGTAALTLPSIQSASTAEQVFDASAALTLPSIESASTADHVFEATAALVLPSIESVSAAELALSATSAIVLPSIESASTAEEVFEATAAIVLPSIESASTGNTGQDVTATAAITLPAIESASTAEEVFEATAALVLPSIESTSTGTVPLNTTATAALVLPAIESASTGQVPITAFVGQKKRIHNALLNAAQLGPFYPVEYDVESDVMLLLGESTEAVIPRSIETNELASRFGVARRNRQDGRRERLSWTWELFLDFQEEVSLESFEADLSLRPIRLPKDKVNGLQQVILNLVDVGYTHPPEHEATSGTQAKLTFDAAVGPS